MQQNKSKLAAAVLVAAIGLGAPALAKSLRNAKPVPSHTSQIAKSQRGRMPDVIGAGGWRAPTFGAPNPSLALYGSQPRSHTRAHATRR